MDNQDSHHHVCYIAYWISNICEISVREFAYSRLMFCLHREGSSVSRENKDVFWASDAERRDTRYVWLTRLARPQWTVGGCFRGFPAFHQRRTTAPPCLCVSHPHPLRPTSVILPPPSRIPLPSPWSALALSFSLFASESPSSPSSSYFHHPRGERWFFNGQRQRTPVSATSARSRVNLIR